MGRPRTILQRRRVLSSVAEGQNYRITLDCGHNRLHSPGVPPPERAYCGECPPEPPK